MSPEDTSNEKIISVPENLLACPECGYADGFQVKLVRTAPDGHELNCRLKLCCPKCKITFDASLYATLKRRLLPGAEQI